MASPNPNYYYNYYGYLIIISCLVLFSGFEFGASDDSVSLLGGKKLIIGVPKKSGFTQFVDAQTNPSNKTQSVKVTGYSIDVFNATLAYLSLYHTISYEFRAFVNDDGSRAGDYNQLLYQIYQKKYDAVVGDVTIVANRSNYVDFTLPYAESGVKMLVKVGHDRHLRMWIFLAPFSWDLWLSIIIFCIFIGVIIHFMERNVNNKEDDEGVENSSRREQLTRVSILWLPLAQVVLPERESVVKNCSRFVLVLWLILACILMQSYTASLSSILTINQLQPNYPNANDLRKDPGIIVGYQDGSFVKELLGDPNRLGFEKSRLKNYSGIDEYKDALDKGSRKGGADAIFDEVPYIKVFLKRYGSKNYAMVGPRYRTDGFGFAFAKDSNLTSYFSRAILNVTEGEEIEEIEERYFGTSDDDELQDQYSTSSSDDTTGPSLTSHSFAGGGDDASSCSSIRKKLKVGVPKKSDFKEFVDAESSATNKSQLVKLSGYSIDVFNATVAHLQSVGCNISFEFEAFADDDGNSAGTYDDLLHQIGKGKYDAVVGDVTIVSNRSNYVDFTLPYAESDVKMLVKVGHVPHLNMWIFLAPFSWDLWLSIIIFCIFVGAIIRFMERNNIVVNGDGGVESQRRQRITTVSVFWLPLAQMVIPETFVLAQSYTASLSSILTVDQLKPNYPNVNHLRRHHEINVGYLRDSFVRDLLENPQGLNFENSRLRNYSGIEEYKDALDKGSRKGGVDAIFDEVPYIKVFLNKYGSKNYALVGPKYRTDGFGFAFPTGSKLTSYFSRAILNVTENKEIMDEIERKYFGNNDDDELEDHWNSSSDDTPSFTTYSFAGLFMVVGVLAILGVLVSESIIMWRKYVMLAKTYGQRILLSRTSRNVTQPSVESSRNKSGDIVGSADIEPNIIHPKVRSRSLSSIDIEMLPV
ncbi:glutamate receptor 2.9-like [Senna tora]|uniref:Glutamate receptor 2.9-like n=1 Tax=Senna tora TaxID=362788 RepID=A0A834SLD5_9FABA|nr:glutamate receptor 2.9-like [Senna tora]